MTNLNIEDKNNLDEMSNSSRAYALFYSFFLIPFMLAIFGALFFFMFQFLTYEKNSPIDLLNNIQSGSATKRWQAAFELSNMLDKTEIDNKELFNNKLKSLFEKSQYDDPKVRAYLALAMGRTGNKEFGDVLIESLMDENPDVRLAIIKSLGMLNYDDSCKDLEKIIISSNNISEVLEATISLGLIGNLDYKNVLVGNLNHEEPNIQWDSAIALAKMNDSSGSKIIKLLLNRNYYKQFPSKSDGSGLDLQEIEGCILTAISVSSILIHSDFKDDLLYLSINDQNIKIRDLALKTFNQYYK